MADSPQKTYTVIVDLPEPGTLRLSLRDAQGTIAATKDFALEGHVDNALLTDVDILLQESIIDRSALVSALPGSGIDKDSALGRIVSSFASALGAAHKATGR
jgi:hypothetical protein